MILPKFSLRTALVAVTALCGYFLILSFAFAGHTWAIAVAVASVAAWKAALIFAALYSFAWLLSLIAGRFGKGTASAFGSPTGNLQSPFATDRLPPVLVSPPPDPMD